MIVKNIPNPLSKDNREKKEISYRIGWNIIDYVMAAGFDLSGQKIIVSGRRIENPKFVPGFYDEIIVTPDIKEPVTSAIWAIGSFIAKHWAASILVASTAYSVYQAISYRAPSYGLSSSSEDESSATYGWNGIQTTMAEGTVIPVIYGRHKTGGHIINAFIENDGENNYLYVLLCLGWGVAESIDDIKIKKQPYANYDGVTVIKRYGTNDQEVIPGFENSHSLQEVDVGLTKDNPHTYTTTGTEVEGFRLNFVISSGLFQVDTASNALASWSVTYKVEYKLHTDPGWIDLGETTITAKTRSAVYRQYEKTGLTPGQYDIRVTRTSDDSSLDPQKSGVLTWNTTDEITTGDFRYPNFVLVAVKALATDQLDGSLPDFSFVVTRKTRAPQVMNGESVVNWEDYYYYQNSEQFRLLSDDTVLSWDGETYTEHLCANPSWIMRDLMTNTLYGIGRFVGSEYINDPRLLEAAKHFEERVPDGSGGYAKRARIDCILDSDSYALDVLVSLCASAPALPFHSSGKVNIIADKDETPQQMFGMGNIIKKSLSESWKSGKEMYNVVEVQFLNKDKDYETDTAVWTDDESIAAGNPPIKKTMSAYVTYPYLAARLARRIGKEAKYKVRTMEYSVAMDGVLCQPGDVVSVCHDIPSILKAASGRVRTGSTTTTIKIDKQVTIEAATTYKLRIRFADDTIEEKTVTNSPGTTDEITVSEAFTQAPALADIYFFGEADNVKEDFRIMSLTSGVNGEGKFVLLEHRNEVYDDTAPDIPDDNYTPADNELKDVTDLLLTEGIIYNENGTFVNCVEVSWQKPQYANNNTLGIYSYADVYFSDDNGVSWQHAGTSYGTDFQITSSLLRVGYTYKVAVVSAGKYTKRYISQSPQDSITLTGGNTAPPAINNLQVYGMGSATYFTGADCKFTWTRVSRYGAGDTGAGEDGAGYAYCDVNFKDFEIQILVNGNVVRTEFVTDNWYEYTWEKNAADNNGNAAGEFTIRIWQRNYYNRRSDSYVELAVTNPAPKQVSGVTYDFSGKDCVISWSPRPSCDIDHRRYKIVITGDGGARTYYRDATSFFYSYDENVDQNGGTGSRSLTIDIYAEDWFGQLSPATTISPVNAAPAAPTVTVTPFFNLAMLKWDDVADTDLRYYEIWQSTTGAWGGEEQLATKVSGTMAMPKNDADDAKLYFKVRGVDSFGSGEFSAAAEAEFVQIDTDDLGDEVITAAKVTTAELITLSAQIAEGIIENAHIANLDGGKITASSITADKLNVTQMSAITANLGTVTAGTLTGTTIQTAESGARVLLDTEKLVAYDNAAAEIFKILLTGADVGDVIFGNTATAYMRWDKSASKLVISNIESPDYVQYSTGYKLSAVGGLEVWSGEIRPNLGGGYIGNYSTGDGTDGTVTLNTQTTYTDCIKQFENLTINAGVTLFLDNSIILVRKRLTIAGTISADGKGYAGGNGGSSNGEITTAGEGLLSDLANNMLNFLGFFGGGGGGAGCGTASNSNGGQSSGASGTYNGSDDDGGDGGNGVMITFQRTFLDLYRLLQCKGGGGGGGNGQGDRNGGDGGAGGGTIIIMCKELDFQTGAVMTADGANGTNGTGSDSGGGGGGGGGLIFVSYKTLVANNGTTTVTGGTGGTGVIWHDGGDGGNGSVSIFQFPD